MKSLRRTKIISSLAFSLIIQCFIVLILSLLSVTTTYDWSNRQGWKVTTLMLIAAGGCKNPSQMGKTTIFCTLVEKFGPKVCFLHLKGFLLPWRRRFLRIGEKLFLSSMDIKIFLPIWLRFSWYQFCKSWSSCYWRSDSCYSSQWSTGCSWLKRRGSTAWSWYSCSIFVWGFLIHWQEFTSQGQDEIGLPNLLKLIIFKLIRLRVNLSTSLMCCVL